MSVKSFKSCFLKILLAASNNWGMQGICLQSYFCACFYCSPSGIQSILAIPKHFHFFNIRISFFSKNRDFSKTLRKQTSVWFNLRPVPIGLLYFEFQTFLNIFLGFLGTPLFWWRWLLILSTHFFSLALQPQRALAYLHETLRFTSVFFSILDNR
jgi:hypothetical protein